MNTFRIDEDFKESLGAATTKSLAHALGTMFEVLRKAVTTKDFQNLRESIDGSVSRLEAAMGRLAETQARTEPRVGDLAEAQARTLRRAGLAPVALVARDVISPESLGFARMRGVRIWCNGSMVEAAA